MTRAQALTVARRLYGKQAIVRENRHESSAEKRADAWRRAQEASARLDAIQTELHDRLAALPWYVALIEEKKQVNQARSDARAWIHYHRCTIGRDLGFAIEVKAEGDTWADAVANAEAKEKR